jgi:hypothetical protein
MSIGIRERRAIDGDDPLVTKVLALGRKTRFNPPQTIQSSQLRDFSHVIIDYKRYEKNMKA